MIEPGRGHEAAEVGEVLHANALFAGVGRRPHSTVRTGRATRRTDATGTGPK